MSDVSGGAEVIKPPSMTDSSPDLACPDDAVNAANDGNGDAEAVDMPNTNGNDDLDHSDRPPSAKRPEGEVLERQEQEEIAAVAATAVEEHLLAEQSESINVGGPVASDTEPPFVGTTAHDSYQKAPWLGSRGASSAAGAAHRFPSLTPNMAHIARLPSPRGSRGQHMVTSKVQMLTRAVNPNKIVNLSKVTMSARAKVATSHPSNYVFNCHRPRKVITWDEAMNARPPLRIDMEGPTPCSYSPAAKPLQETNSPQWTLGGRTFVEKVGGSRTSWEKTWFQSPEVWTQKTNFLGDRRWPTPSQYENQQALGPHHPTNKVGVAHSIGIRRTFVINKKGSESEPAPNEYNKEKSDIVTRKRAPSYTHSFRRGGTLLWSVGDSVDTPGPGAYNPRMNSLKRHQPAFTIQGIRREKSSVLGPYATF